MRKLTSIQKVREAIKGSIKKWERIEVGKLKDHGGSNCPLCRLFTLTNGGNCFDCPVYAVSCMQNCVATPYEAYRKHMVECTKRNCPTCVRLAHKEVNFLKTVLDYFERSK